jgi:heme exporter protein CcmD
VRDGFAGASFVEPGLQILEDVDLAADPRLERFVGDKERVRRVAAATASSLRSVSGARRRCAREFAAFSPPRASAKASAMSHAAFIWAAYAVALVGLGGLVVASIAARRRVRRELSARGLERPRDQRAGASR